MNEPLIIVTLAGIEAPALLAQVSAGLMPRLAAIIADGASGPLRVVGPAGAAGWATLATGRFPEVHGIVMEREAWAGGLRPTGKASWKAAPFWQRLNDVGLSTIGVAWPASAPGAAWPGVQVDDRLIRLSGETWNDWTLPHDVVAPRWREAIRSARVHVDDISRDMVAPFFPALVAEGLSGDRAALPVAAAMARLMTTQGVAATLMGTIGWDVLAVHHDVGGFACGGGLLGPAWALLDASLASLLDTAPVPSRIMLVTVDGVRATGMMFAAGAGIGAGDRIRGASILDVAPTIYGMLGFGDPDLPGRPLFGVRGTPRRLSAERPTPSRPVDRDDLTRVERFGFIAPTVPPQWRVEHLVAEAGVMFERDLAGAARRARQALAVDRRNMLALAVVAMSCAADRDSAGLAEIAGTMEEIAPDHPWTILASAGRHVLMGDRAAAEPLLRAAERSGGRDEALRVAQARLMLRRNDEAKRTLSVILDRDAGDIPAMLTMAEALEHEPTKAEAMLRRVLSLEPYHRGARAALARSLRRVGRTREAAALLSATS